MGEEPEKSFPADPLDGSEVVGRRFVWRKGYTYILALVTAALLFFVVIYFGIQLFGGKVTNREEFLDMLGGSGYALVLLMGIIGSSSPIWPMPGSWAALIAAAVGMNPLLIALAAGFGEPLGEISGYLAGYSGQVVAEKLRWYKRIVEWMRRWGGPTIFLVSAVPNFFTKLATAGAGALRYPMWKFFLFCWAGKTIKSLGFALVGWAVGTRLIDWFFGRFA